MGLLLLQEAEYVMPMATTERWLVASINRGCKAIHGERICGYECTRFGIRCASQRRARAIARVKIWGGWVWRHWTKGGNAGEGDAISVCEKTLQKRQRRLYLSPSFRRISSCFAPATPTPGAAEGEVHCSSSFSARRSSSASFLVLWCKNSVW